MSAKLDKALRDWFNTPINDYGTPYVSHPEDFTPAEQREFIDLIEQPRYVPRDEQVALLRAIIARRKSGKPQRNAMTTTKKRSSKRKSSKRRSSKQPAAPQKLRANYRAPERGWKSEPRPGDVDEETGELTMRGKIREEMIQKLAAEWNEANSRLEERSFRSREDRDEEAEAEWEAMQDRAYEHANARLEEMADLGEVPPGKEDEILDRLTQKELKKLEEERKSRANVDAERMSVIEELLGELGARMMRPYEHWNEEEAYMEHAERDRDGDY